MSIVDVPECIRILNLTELEYGLFCVAFIRIRSTAGGEPLLPAIFRGIPVISRVNVFR